MRTGLWVALGAAACSEYELKGEEPQTGEPPPPSPAIVLDPTALEFGQVSQGEQAELPFTVTNAGDASLALGELTIEGDDAFALGADPSGAFLAPGEAIGGSVRFEPQGTERFAAVRVPSSDPSHPTSTIELHGAPALAGLALEPMLVDLGYVEVGTEAWAEVTATNVGEWRAELAAATVTGPEFRVEGFAPVTLDASESAAIGVAFAPSAAAPFHDVLVVAMDGVGEASVELVGTGVERPVAACDALPAAPVLTLDDVTWIGSASSDPAGRPITASWSLVSAPVGSFALLPPAVGLDLPGFVPDLPGVYEAELTVVNDVGLSATCRASVQAIDGKPTAACAVSPDPVEALHEAATWSGAGSVDPLGGTLEYAWSLVAQPAGSAVGMPTGAIGSPDRAGFVADLVGTYTGELVVTNDRGLSSDPCVVDLDAEPGGDLWVETYWDHGNDDMDLHLVRAGGALRTGQDCFFNNCLSGLSWGPAGPDGDPILDLDDIIGKGPENINVSAPEDVVYHVWVHDFSGHVWNGANDVTVNVYLGGALAWTGTLPVSGEGTDTWFADIDWATQTVTP